MILRRLQEFIAGPPSPVDQGLRELEEFIAEVGGGRIGPVHRRADGIYVGLLARDGERYMLRMVPTVYLEAPLRCTFVDARYAPGSAAWPYPARDGPFRAPQFICTPPTAEFYAAHRERRYRWGEGSFVNTVATVFAALHAPQYRGRWGRRDDPD